MGFGPLLLALEALRIERIRLTPDAVILELASSEAFSHCPECGRRSSRMHSHYGRHLRDLPAHGRVMQLNLHLRRFFCDHPDCPKQTFAERLPTVVQPHARRTCRLGAAMQDIAFACGGEGGARLARELAMPTSPDTLLRLMRRAPATPFKVPQVLGVDDWAIRRGQRYGTILCDLELHKPIELLPERSSDGLAAWLSDHPGIEIIARDRGGDYARGATMGAPDAVQVADRWHLLHNLHEALERALDRQHLLLSEAAKKVAAGEASTAVESAPSMSPKPPVRPAYLRRRQEQSRARRLQRYEQVKQLQADGLSLRQIAARLKLDRGTVRRLTRAEAFPERAAPSRRATGLDRFIEQLRSRWEAGCHNSAKLYRELNDLGYKGSYPTVQRKVLAWRTTKEPGQQTGPPMSRRQQIWRPSPRTVAWLLLDSQLARSSEQHAFLAALHRLWPDLGESVALIQEFSRLLQEHDADSLEAWVQLAGEETILPEVRKFARVLRRDWAAVLEAVRGPWSSGQVEGQINRLKLIKRQMYGRANFDLLRQRVLYAN